MGLAIGVPRAGRADWPLGLHSRPPYHPHTHSRPGGAAATWGVARGWHWDRTPSSPGCVGPAFPLRWRLRARPVPPSTRAAFLAAFHRGDGDCGLREALGLRAATQPPTLPTALPRPPGQDSRERQAARVPGAVPALLLTSPASSPAASSSHRAVFCAPVGPISVSPFFLLDPASQLRRPLRS